MNLTDSFGRTHRKLRISVTDRCNMRCRYCMAEDHAAWMPKEAILTFEEITRAAQIFASLGVTRFRLTGGEPTLRKDIVKLMSMLSKISGKTFLSMTTNGVFLEKYAAEFKRAGLNSVTVSLDTLNPLKFRNITRTDYFSNVLNGIRAADDVGFPSLKINCVVMRGVNDDELLDFVSFSVETRRVVRFIEFMPLDDKQRWKKESVVTQDEMIKQIKTKFHLEPDAQNMSSPARTFSVNGGKGEIGFISSVSRPFCASCDRLRLTADGKIRNCLFASEEYDLMPFLRGNAADEEIKSFLEFCVFQKKEGHSIGAGSFEKPSRPMHAIGG